jgi:predicted enzyme related to lactoylglutathione lyase
VSIVGRPVHFEIHGSDPQALVAFYQGVFDWKIDQWSDEAYWLVATGDGPGIDGAILPRRGPSPEAGAPVSAFVVTVAVDDLDRTLETAYAAGATEALPRVAVPRIGWLAYIHDPDGNLVGVLQADESAGS